MVIEAGPTVEEGDVDLVWFCLSELEVPADFAVTASTGFPHSVAFFVNGSVNVAGQLLFVGDSATRLLPVRAARAEHRALL